MRLWTNFPAHKLWGGALYALLLHPHNLYFKLYQMISLYTHSLPLNVLTKFSVLRVLGLKKAFKICLFNNFKTKFLIFEYFPKISLEMNSFYTILIPSTPYVKFKFSFFLIVTQGQGGPKTLKHLMISKRY